MSNASNKPLAAVVSAAFLTAAAAAPLANADSNPFGMQSLASGYDLANYSKHREGGCGAKSNGEGSCGGKAKGEGSCGGKAAKGEGSCGAKGKEGSCGGEKAAHRGDKADKADKEGKCGEGKCGGKQ